MNKNNIKDFVENLRKETIDVITAMYTVLGDVLETLTTRFPAVELKVDNSGENFMMDLNDGDVILIGLDSHKRIIVNFNKRDVNAVNDDVGEPVAAFAIKTTGESEFKFGPKTDDTEGLRALALSIFSELTVVEEELTTAEELTATAVEVVE